MSIVAHELEHVAAPSPVARFHGGVDSPEERRAAATEQVVRRLAAEIDQRGGPEASAGIAGLPVAALSGFSRAGGGGLDATAGGPPVPASALGDGSPAGTVQRAPTSRVRRPTEPRPQGPTSRVRRPGAQEQEPAQPGSAQSPVSGGSDQAPALSPAQLSAIIRAVEDRLLEEIERRGGLSRGAF
jgi:hypothetical protein